MTNFDFLKSAPDFDTFALCLAADYIKNQPGDLPYYLKWDFPGDFKE